MVCSLSFMSALVALVALTDNTETAKRLSRRFHCKIHCGIQAASRKKVTHNYLGARQEITKRLSVSDNRFCEQIGYP
jgi:hypothetical protein